MPSGNLSQYNPPPDVTNASGWMSSIPTKVAGFPISNFKSFAAIRMLSAPQVTCFAQVLFIHDDRHLVADGVKTGVVY